MNGAILPGHPDYDRKLHGLHGMSADGQFYQGPVQPAQSSDAAGIRRTIVGLFSTEDLWHNYSMPVEQIHEAVVAICRYPYRAEQTQAVLTALVREKRLRSRMGQFGKRIYERVL